MKSSDLITIAIAATAFHAPPTYPDFLSASDEADERAAQTYAITSINVAVLDLRYALSYAATLWAREYLTSHIQALEDIQSDLKGWSASIEETVSLSKRAKE